MFTILTSGEVTPDDPEAEETDDDTEALLALVMGGLRISGLNRADLVGFLLVSVISEVLFLYVLGFYKNANFLKYMYIQYNFFFIKCF